MDFLVLRQFTFNSHRSDCQKTLATDRVYGAIFVMPVGECGFRLVGQGSAGDCRPYADQVG